MNEDKNELAVLLLVGLLAVCFTAIFIVGMLTGPK